MEQRRKAILIGVAGAMAALMGGRWAWDGYVVEPIDKQRKAVKNAKSKLDETNQKIVAARLDALDLQDLSQFCLPGDLTLAQDQYQGYLIDLFESQGIVSPSLAPGQVSVREGVTFLSFTIQATGTMYALRQVLHEYYRAPRLQQIRRLSLTPIERTDTGADLRFSLTTEAVAFGDSDSEESEASWEPRVAIRADEYKAMVEKPLLSTSGVAGAIPANSPQHVALVSILLQEDKAEAEIYDRGANRMRRAAVGDRLAIGPVNAKLLDIGRRDLILLANGRLWQWTLGTTLSERTPLSIQAALDWEVRESRFRSGQTQAERERNAPEGDVARH